LKKFLEIEPEFSKYDTSKIVVLPVPYEATTSYGKGTKKGPDAILDASQIVEDYDIELECEPYKKLGIHTLPPLRLKGDPHKEICGAVKNILKDHKISVMLGGEHSISYGAVKACKEKFPELSVLQFDAHLDLRNSYHASKFSHASVMRRIQELGCSCVQVGIRSQDIEEAEYIKENDLMDSIFYAHEFEDSKIPEIVNKLSSDVYITFDVDALDPSIMPATGTPEPGGLYWDQVLKMLRAVISEKNIVGFDVVELSPKPNLHFANYTAAKLVYKMIGFISKHLT
jgi:agmatinase